MFFEIFKNIIQKKTRLQCIACYKHAYLICLLDNFFYNSFSIWTINFISASIYAEAKRERDKQNFESISMDNVIFLVCNEYSFDHTGCWRLAYKPIYRSPNHLMYSLNTTSKDYISEMFVVFLQDLLYSYVFCNIQCAKTALQKLVKSEALKVTVYRVYTDWHMLI